MIPGKQYTLEDIVEIAWRRRWFIVAPFLIAAALTIVVAQLLPDRYRSEAVLQVVPQQVPEKYVTSAVNTRLDSRLQLLAQQILSRTQLERVIQEFNLYPDERRRMIMEDVVERMRSRDILIGGRGGGHIDANSFSIGFESTNPKTSMQVAERLSGLFIQENLQDRSVYAEQTGQFLQSQLDDTRRQLKDYETKLEAFRRSNPGRMPGEMETTQQVLAAAQSQLQSVQESIYRDRDRQLMLQRMISDAKAAAAAAAIAPPPVADSKSAPMTASQQLEGARTGLRNMEMRLKPDHPDIKAQKRFIRDLEQKAAAEALQQPVSTTAPVDLAQATRVSDMQNEADAIDRRLASKTQDEKKLLDTINGYRGRLESVPTVETHLTELMRDYTTLQATYQSLLTKSQEAKVAENLERRQIGEQFKIIDAARMPQRPYSPNRPLVILVGCFLGLGLGVGMAGLLEYQDKSLRTEDDVIAALALPVLALVPTMITKIERERNRHKRRLLAASGAGALVLSAVVLMWKFQAIADWIR